MTRYHVIVRAERPGSLRAINVKVDAQDEREARNLAIERVTKVSPRGTKVTTTFAEVIV